MSRKFKTLESRMSAESVARSDETYARLKARMDLARKDKGQAKACPTQPVPARPRTSRSPSSPSA